jgi:hypothetical protein
MIWCLCLSTGKARYVAYAVGAYAMVKVDTISYVITEDLL